MIGELTKEEQSLLLYLETRAVDHGGLLDSIHMDKTDIDLAKTWDTCGFIRFGRVCFSDIRATRTHCLSGWVELSEQAWAMAHKLRREKAERRMLNRTWKKTKDKP